jgi:predicted NBD/HSP70 family sugar kinase
MSETVPHSRLASCVLFSRSHGVHFRLRLTRTTGRPFRSGCARPPRLLTMSQQKCVIAVDIHPRQTTLALTEISGRIAWQSVLSLPQDPTQAINRLTEAIQSAIHTHVGRIIEGIGVCLPGRTGPNAKDLIFIFAPNLRWPIVSLKAKIERASGLRVRMDNVANACALSEVWSKGVSRQKCVALRDL